jgi:hypothetical protein
VSVDEYSAVARELIGGHLPVLVPELGEQTNGSLLLPGLTQAADGDAEGGQVRPAQAVGLVNAAEQRDASSAPHPKRFLPLGT